MFVQSADTSGGKNGIFAVNLQHFAVSGLGDHAGALAIFFQNVSHGGVFHDGDVGERLHGAKKHSGDFLAGHIFMKTDAWTGVGALFCVKQGTVRILSEADTQAQQVVNDGPAAPDHDIDTLPTVLVMAGTHGILKIGIVIIVIPEDADAALGQHGIADVKTSLG